jgi:hypothetical protein
LQVENARLKEEVAELRSLITVNESNIQIEQAAQQQLAEKNTLLVQENARLKEDLAVFERLTRLDDGRTDNEVALDQLSIKADQSAGGRYRYSFLIALQGARRGKESAFRLELVLLPPKGKSDDKIVLPRAAEQNDEQYTIVLRNFRRIEGGFIVPDGFPLGAVEIRILEGNLLKGSKRLSL